MKAPCLADLLNHTFPLDHCLKGLHSLCQPRAHALRIIHFWASCTINSSVFFPRNGKSFQPAWLYKIWLNLLDLPVGILHIEGLNLILKSFSPYENSSPSALQMLLFSSWKTGMALRESLRGSKLLWTLLSATRWAHFSVSLKNHYKN